MHRAMLAAPVLFCLTACGPHTIRGRVIEGDISYISVVDAGDHRLKQAGVPGVSLRLEMDPARLNRKLVAQEVSGEDGSFALPVDEFGAGLLEMDMGLLARRRGFRSAEGAFRLPSQSRRVLIVMARGEDDRAEEAESPREMLERFR